MKYNIEDIKKDVRIAMDENSSNAALAGLEDVDTLMLDEIIGSKVADAARIVEANAPHYLLDSGKPFGESIGWDSEPGFGSGHIHLPDDFMRLVTFQMSDWRRAVVDPITEDDPLYAQQISRFPGIRGNPQRPVVAIVQQPIGLVLEFYSCTGGENVYVKKARYIPVPKVRDGEIEICEKLRPSVVYYTAHMAALTIGHDNLAQSLLVAAQNLMDYQSQQ